MKSQIINYAYSNELGRLSEFRSCLYKSIYCSRRNAWRIFFNAMEIIFHESDAAARLRNGLHRLGFHRYRMKQTIEERDFQLFRNRWSLFYSKPEDTTDDPLADGVQSWNPPYFRMFDTPGWSPYTGVGLNSRVLGVANGISSDINATEVWIQQLFKTWVQCENYFSGRWSDVSIKIKWNNSIHLVRDTPSSPWKIGHSSRINHGPMAFGNTALL